MPLWLLLADKAKGYALELHPAPIQWGRPPRPFSPGPEGENFTDFDLRWLSDTPSKNAQTWGNRWREPLDKNDPLQRSALKSGALAYRLLYHSVDNPLRQQCTVRFQLDEAELLAEGGGRGISGESGDLLFALAVVTVSQPRSGGYPPLAATGVLDEAGRVKYVTGVADKLRAYLTAIANLPETTPVKTDGNGEQGKALFFHPRANDDDLSPELRKTAHQAGVRLIAVESLEEALCALGITVKDYWEGNPYQGFGFFDTAHRRIFFGRETESAIVCEKLLQREKDGTPGILVMASSGRGKSSLVRAGVIPHLQKHEALLERPIFHRVCRLPQDVDKNDPAASEAALVNALRQEWAKLPELQHMEVTQEDTTNADTLSALADAVAQVLPQTRPFVWVIDPMEELFTNYPAATVEAFGVFLKRLQILGVWPIATLRSEYGHDYQNTNLLDVFGDAHILPKLHETLLEQAIRGPAKLAKLDFETDPATGINLAAHIRDEALQGGEDMLPLLGFVLSKLYDGPERKKQNDGWLKWVDYRCLGGLPDASQQPHEQLPTAKPDQKPGHFSQLLSRLCRREKAQPRPPLISTQAPCIGGLAGAVGHYANKLLADCSTEEHNILPKVLLHLVRLSEDGNQALRQRAHLKAFAAEPQQASLVRKLIDGRLLISHIDANTEEPTVELVHDCLLTTWDKVGAAIKQHRELLEEKRKLSNAALHWERNGRPERLLIGKADEVLRTEVLVDYLGNKNIDPCVFSFLCESIKFTRTGFKMYFILILLILVNGLYVSYKTFFNHFEVANLTITMLLYFSVIFAFCAGFVVYFFREAFYSFKPKPYLKSIKYDLVLSIINAICLAVLWVVLVFFSPNKGMDIEKAIFFGWICFFILVTIVYKQANKVRIIGWHKVRNESYFMRNLPKTMPSLSIKNWVLIEFFIWIIIFITITSSWGQWRKSNEIMKDFQDFAFGYAASLYGQAGENIAKHDLQSALITMSKADKVLSFYSTNFNLDYFKLNFIAWDLHIDPFSDENFALQLMQLYSKKSNLSIILSEYPEAYYYCVMSEIILGFWIEKSTEKNKWLELAHNIFKTESTIKIKMSSLDAAEKDLEYAKKAFFLAYGKDIEKHRNEAADLIIKEGAILEGKKLYDYALESYLLAKHILEPIANQERPNLNVIIQSFDVYLSIVRIARETKNADAENGGITSIKIYTDKILRDYQKLAEEAMIIKSGVGRALGNTSYNELFVRQYNAALKDSIKALELAPNEIWIKTNIAHALLFLNRFDEAKAIYEKSANEKIFSGKKIFRQVVLEDFKKFREYHIDHPDMKKIEQLYNM